MILRIAAGLAHNSAIEHRWRRVTVPISAAVFMLLMLAGISVVTMVQREANREAGRTALLAAEPSPQDLLLFRGNDVWRGEQYPVIWVQPSGSAMPNLPPGMKQFPKPGQAVVSPELDRLASQDPDLSARYPHRLVLGVKGVRSGSELFAYVRMPDNRTLTGNRAAFRVQGFGLPSGPVRSLPLALEPSEVTVPLAIEGALGFLFVPGLLVLAVGLATASSVRNRRFEVLRSIGVPERVLTVLAILETATLAVPGLLAATVLWSMVAPRLQQVPLVGRDVVRGDLGLPWWLLLAALGVGIAAVSLVAVMVSAVQRRRERGGPRPASRNTTLTPLRAAPLAFAFVAFVLAELLQGDLAGTLNLAGIVAAIGGLPLALPGVLRVAGSVLGRLQSVSASIAGRNLQWAPVQATRPFAGAAALVVIILAASGYIALAREVEPSTSHASGPQAATVYWVDPHPDDTGHLASALDGTELVAPIREEGNTLVVGATCNQLASQFTRVTCNPESPFALPPQTSQGLGADLLGYPGVKVRLVPGDELATSGSAFVVDDTALKNLEERVRSAAMNTLPAPYVQSGLSMVMSESPLVAWIVSGILVAAIALMVGCFFSLVDRLLASHKYHRHLLNLGVVPGRLTVLEAWLFAVPYGVVVTLSFIVGLLICANIVGISSGVPMPWRDIGIILGIAVATGLLGTVSVAFLGAKSFWASPGKTDTLEWGR